MPCCTLIAFVLSQLGLGAGAARVRYLGRLSFLHPGQLDGWKAVALAGILGLEIVLTSAAFSLVFTAHGRSDASNSFEHAWQICSVSLGAIADAARRN